MKSFLAFFKKEWTEQLRTGRLTILFILFILFGIMSPAIAKLTPWMMETFSSSLAENGMIVTNMEVTAITSWTQFYKNIPIGFIVFVLITCDFFTGEYQKGTLVLVLTKGLSRVKALLAKTLMMIILWTAGFFLCYSITYGYTAYFWDNSIVQHLAFAAFGYYLFGVWMISIMVLCSSFVSSNIGVIFGTFASFIGTYLISFLPSLKKYVPIRLTDSMSIVTGTLLPEDITWAICITLFFILINFIFAIFAFNKCNL